MKNTESNLKNKDTSNEHKENNNQNQVGVSDPINVDELESGNYDNDQFISINAENDKEKEKEKEKGKENNNEKEVSQNENYNDFEMEGVQSHNENIENNVAKDDAYQVMLNSNQKQKEEEFNKNMNVKNNENIENREIKVNNVHEDDKDKKQNDINNMNKESQDIKEIKSSENKENIEKIEQNDKSLENANQKINKEKKNENNSENNKIEEKNQKIDSDKNNIESKVNEENQEKKEEENNKKEKKENAKNNISNENKKNDKTKENLKKTHTKENKKDKLLINADSTKKQKIITLKDLANNTEKILRINSPRSKKIIEEKGYTMKELLYVPIEKFAEVHEETLKMDDEEKQTRYNFYEELRKHKIRKLCNLRENMIKRENENSSNIKENLSNNKQNEISESVGEEILQNEEKIVNNQLKRENNRYQKELANVVEYELSKDLIKLRKSCVQANYPENINNQLYSTQTTNNIENYKSTDIPNFNNYTPIHNAEIGKNKTFNDNLNIFQQTKRNQSYEINQEKLQQRIERLNKRNKEKEEQYKSKNQLNTERAMACLKLSNNRFDLKLLNVINQHEKKEIRIINNKKRIEEQRKEKKEKNAQKLIRKLDYIDKMQRLEYLYRQQKYNKYLEHESQRGKVKIEKNNIVKSKSTKFGELGEQRQKNISKIKRILRNPDDENLLKLINEFPDNDDIKRAIKDYESKKSDLEKNINLALERNQNKEKENEKEKEKEKENTLSRTSKSIKNNNFFDSRSVEKKKIRIYAIENNKDSNQNKQTNKKIEEEIKTKVKEYQDMLYKEFWKRVENEKKNENLRSEQLKILDDEDIKKNLENQFKKERSIVNRRLKNEYEDIQRDVEEFESFLRNKYY